MPGPRTVSRRLPLVHRGSSVPQRHVADRDAVIGVRGGDDPAGVGVDLEVAVVDEDEVDPPVALIGPVVVVGETVGAHGPLALTVRATLGPEHPLANVAAPARVLAVDLVEDALAAALGVE